MKKRWKFHSTAEQREVYQKRYRPPFDEAAAEVACALANHLWRGTGTQFTVVPIHGGYGLRQDIIAGWEYTTQ